MSARAPGRRLSLLTALFGRTGLVLVMVILSVGVIAFLAAQQRVDKVYDGQLIIGANVLRALMSDELREQAGQSGEEQLEIDDSALLSPEDRRAFDDYAEWRMFRVWRGNRITIRSDTGPPPVPPPAADGFSYLHAPNGDRWRVYTLRVAPYAIAVQVGERTDIRAVLVRDIAVGTALPLLLLVPLIAGLLWLSLRDGLGELRVLMTEIGRRSLTAGAGALAPRPASAGPRDQPAVRPHRAGGPARAKLPRQRRPPAAHAARRREAAGPADRPGDRPR